MSRQIFVGTFSDGTRRVVRTLRGARGMISFERADEFLAWYVGEHFARLWRQAIDSKNIQRGVRWLGEDGLVSRPEESTCAKSWLRYCAEHLDGDGEDSTLVDLIKLSLNKRERELW